jgi:parallel beta-helix repeat protein
LYLIVIRVVLGLIVLGFFPVISPAEQDEPGALPNKSPGEPYVPGNYTTIQLAIDVALPGDTILVVAGIYDGFIVDGKTNLTIQSSSTVIVQGVQVVTTNYGDREAVIFVKDSENIILEGLTIGPNTGRQTQKGYSVIYEHSSGEINNCTVFPDAVGDLNSVAIGVWDNSDITIDSCTIKNFGRIGVFFYNGCTASVLNSTIIGQVYGGGRQVCYGIEVEAAAIANQVIITGNEIYDCDKTFSPELKWGPSGILINGWLEYGPQTDSTVIIENNDIHNNYGGIYVVKSSSSYAHDNNIYDNREYGVESAKAYDDTIALFDAICNWWGDTSGPSIAGNGSGDAINENVDFNPWLLGPTPVSFTGTAPLK